MRFLLLALVLAVPLRAQEDEEEGGDEQITAHEAHAESGAGVHQIARDKDTTPNPSSTEDECKGVTPLPITSFMVQNPNGWWPKVSPTGEWVAYGNQQVSVVSIRDKHERVLQDGCIYPAGWMKPNVLRSSTCEGQAYSLAAPGFSPKPTKDNPALVAGNKIVAANGHWASYLASGGRIAYDDKVMATGAGGGVDVSDDWLIHATTNENQSISVYRGGKLKRTIPAKIPMTEASVTAGYVIYGGGRLRGVAPGAKEIDISVAPSGYLEGGGKVFFVGVSTAARPWIASTMWGNGPCYTMLRPWGEKSGILLDDCASAMSVEEHCGVIVVARCSDKGALKIVTVASNAPRVSFDEVAKTKADASAVIKAGNDFLKQNASSHR